MVVMHDAAAAVGTAVERASVRISFKHAVSDGPMFAAWPVRVNSTFSKRNSPPMKHAVCAPNLYELPGCNVDLRSTHSR